MDAPLPLLAADATPWRLEGALDAAASGVLYDDSDIVWARVVGARGAVALVRPAAPAGSPKGPPPAGGPQVPVRAHGRAALPEARVALADDDADSDDDATPDGDYCALNNAVGDGDTDASERWMLARDTEALLHAAFGERYLSLAVQRARIEADAALDDAARAAALAPLVPQRTPPWFAARRGPDPARPRTGGSSHAVLCGALARLVPKDTRFATYVALEWARVCGRVRDAATLAMRTGRVGECGVVASYLAARPHVRALETGLCRISEERFASPDALLVDATLRRDALPAWVRAEIEAHEREHPGAPPVDVTRGVLECKVSRTTHDFSDTYFAQLYAEMEASGAWWGDLCKYAPPAPGAPPQRGPQVAVVRVYRVYRSPKTMRVLAAAYDKMRDELERHGGAAWREPRDVPWPVGTLDEWTRLWRATFGFNKTWHEDVPYVGAPLVAYATRARDDAAAVAEELRAACAAGAEAREDAREDALRDSRREFERAMRAGAALEVNLDDAAAQRELEDAFECGLRAAKRVRRT